MDIDNISNKLQTKLIAVIDRQESSQHWPYCYEVRVSVFFLYESIKSMLFCFYAFCERSFACWLLLVLNKASGYFQHACHLIIVKIICLLR